MIKKTIALIRKNYKLLFCYFLLFLAVLFFLLILWIDPKKNETIYLYDNLKKSELITVNELTQYIYPKQDTINAFRVFFDDYSIDKCNFTIKIEDENNNKYFEQSITDYTQDQLYLYMGDIENAANKKFKLTIIPDNCSGFKVQVVNNDSKHTYIDGYKGNTLKIAVDCLKRNKSYNWYSLLFIAIALLLFPLARRDK